MSDRENSDHLANLSDGAGCAEVWEHLSEQRENAAEEADEEDDTDEAVTNEETADADDDAPEQDAAAAPCP